MKPMEEMDELPEGAAAPGMPGGPELEESPEAEALEGEEGAPAVHTGPKKPVRDNSEAVRDIVAWDMWAQGALTEPFTEMLDHRRLYHSSRRDHRKAHEKTWRALTHEPYPFTIVEGKVAVVSDILNSTDPNIQATGIGDEDVPVARKVEKLLDYTMRENRWRLRCEELVREAAIDGTSAMKVVWRHDTARVRAADPEAEQLFDDMIATAQESGLEVPEDPNEYESFREESGLSAALPPHPRTQFREVTTFKAPSFERVSLTDLRFDPLEPVWTNQRRVAQLIVKPTKWVRDRAGAAANLPFAEAAVERAITAMSGEKFDQYQTAIAEMMGAGSATTGYYGRRDLCFILETFDTEDEEMPWKLLLNGLELINKDPFPPYGHGENPINLFRNLPQSGNALGQSELKAPRKQIETLWALYDLLVDNVTLNTLGVYTRLQDLGIPEIARVLRPGHSIPLPRLDALKRLDMGSVHPDVWKMLPYLKASIDDTTSISSQLRGNPALINRVSANESSKRNENAERRPKGAAVRFEEELRRPIKQALWLWYEHGDPEILVKIGGQGADEYQLTVSKDELLIALAYDFAFRGPSMAQSRELLTQQAMQWYTTFGMLLPQHRQLAYAAQVYDIMDIKGRGQVLPDSDIQAALAATMAPPPAAVDPVTGLPIDPNAPPPMEAPPMEAPPPEPAPEPEPQPKKKKKSRRKRTVERDREGNIAAIIDDTEEEN